MRIISILSLLFLVNNITVGQYKGMVVDTGTNEKIGGAHIYFKKSLKGTISNTKGEFELSKHLESTTDRLKISCVGYQSKTVVLSGPSIPFIVALHPETVTLNPVVITPLSALEIVKNSIKNIKANHLNHKTDLLLYYWHSTKEEGIYKCLGTQVINLSYPQLEDHQIVQDSLYKDFRKFKIDEINIFQDVIRFNHLSPARGFLKKDNLTSWRFSKAGGATYDNEDYFIIKATYLSELLSHSATLYINQSDYGLARICFSYDWSNTSHEKNSGYAIICRHKKGRRKNVFFKAGRKVLSGYCRDYS